MDKEGFWAQRDDGVRGVGNDTRAVKVSLFVSLILFELVLYEGDDGLVTIHKQSRYWYSVFVFVFVFVVDKDKEGFWG